MKKTLSYDELLKQQLMSTKEYAAFVEEKRRERQRQKNFSGRIVYSMNSLFGGRLNKELKEYVPAGAKYNHVGHRKGVAGALDRGIIADNIAHTERNYGGGAYEFALVGDSAGAPLPFGGRLYYPDKDGKFRVVDGDFLAHKQKLYDEREQQINKILKSAVTSTEIAQLVLGKAYDDNKAPGVGPAEMPRNVKDASCDIDVLAALPGDSKEYSLGVAKLRWLIKHQMPIIEDSTPASVANAGVE